MHKYPPTKTICFTVKNSDIAKQLVSFAETNLIHAYNVQCAYSYSKEAEDFLPVVRFFSLAKYMDKNCKLFSDELSQLESV